jgi:hypothetical protein
LPNLTTSIHNILISLTPITTQSNEVYTWPSFDNPTGGACVMRLLDAPAHSCKHCQRIVLRSEHFESDSCTIKLPHTAQEIRRAFEDGCKFLGIFYWPRPVFYKGEFASTKLVRREPRWLSLHPERYVRRPSILRWYYTWAKSSLGFGTFWIKIYNLESPNVPRWVSQGKISSKPGYVLCPVYDHMCMTTFCRNIKALPGM